MGNGSATQTRSLAGFCLFIVWLVINIRVSAGYASTFERALDGLVGVLVLLVAILLAVRFFGGLADRDSEQDGEGR